MRYLIFSAALVLAACQISPEQSARLSQAGQSLSAIDNQGAGGVTCSTFGNMTTCQ